MYYLLLIILYPISLLPLEVLYLLSDFGFVIIYRVFGYRKAIVLDNLQHAFPEKDEQELHTISVQFYRFFCDQWVETLKLLSISKKEINRRMHGNWEVFKKLADEGRNAYAMMGHQFNWEWANIACQNNSEQRCFGVYLPLENKAMDRLIQRIRTRSGSGLISMKAQKSGFAQLQGIRYIVGLFADQNPSVVEVAEWIPFMHREAPFFRGPEQLARRAKAAVVFAGFTRLRRGYYDFHIELFTEDASQTSKGDILNAYVQFLERRLNAQPANYLWTHRRWKHKRKAADKIVADKEDSRS